MNDTRAAQSEACYCGTRWVRTARGLRYCPHCDRPPAVRFVAALIDGVEQYGYRCPRGCVHCATVNRRVWGLA